MKILKVQVSIDPIWGNGEVLTMLGFLKYVAK